MTIVEQILKAREEFIEHTGKKPDRISLTHGTISILEKELVSLYQTYRIGKLLGMELLSVKCSSEQSISLVKESVFSVRNNIHQRVIEEAFLKLELNLEQGE